jgi:hypothetical protein
MAYQIVPEPGEQVQVKIDLKLSKKAKPFHFGISDRALYIPRVKLIAKTDPYYFQQVRLESVQQVSVKRLPAFALWLLGGLMICGGLVMGWLLLLPFLNHEPGFHHVSGWPFGLVVGGFLLPFAAKNRFGLEIVFSEGTFRWKPPLVFGAVARGRILETLDSIVSACEHVGTRGTDERRERQLKG